MQRLHQLLLDNYTEHYGRTNTDVDPRGVTKSHLRQMQRTYGPFVCGLPPGSRVLDLGCGTGYLLRWLSLQPGVVPVGVDASPSQVGVARRALPDVEVFCEDGLEFLQTNKGRFSAIFCTDVLEHISEPDRCLEWLEAARVALRDGGFFLCRVPNAANLLAAYSRYMDLTHYRSFTSTSLLQLMEAAGFERSSVVPYRPGCLLGSVRSYLESFLHRSLFRVCGQNPDTVFTNSLCGVGHRGAEKARA